MEAHCQGNQPELEVGIFSPTSTSGRGDRGWRLSLFTNGMHLPTTDYDEESVRFIAGAKQGVQAAGA